MGQVTAIALVMDTETQHASSPFASLEAMALATQHGFEALGLSRINAGQVYPALAKWNQLLEILGYRAEGFRRQAFRRGHIVSDEVTLACLYLNYTSLLAIRGGALWPGVDRVRTLIRELPRTPFAQLLDESYRALEASYFGDAANTADGAATKPQYQRTPAARFATSTSTRSRALPSARACFTIVRALR